MLSGRELEWHTFFPCVTLVPGIACTAVWKDAFCWLYVPYRNHVIAFKVPGWLWQRSVVWRVEIGWGARYCSQCSSTSNLTSLTNIYFWHFLQLWEPIIKIIPCLLILKRKKSICCYWPIKSKRFNKTFFPFFQPINGGTTWWVSIYINEHKPYGRSVQRIQISFKRCGKNHICVNAHVREFTNKSA